MYFPMKWVWKHTNTFSTLSHEWEALYRGWNLHDYTADDILNFIHSDEKLFQIMSAFEHVEPNLRRRYETGAAEDAGRASEMTV